MNWKFWQEKPSIYDDAIEKVLTELKEHDPETDEFATSMSHLERLSSMKEKGKQIMRVSPDTIAIVVGNLIGILIIVAYEQNHAMTSKGLNYVKAKTP